MVTCSVASLLASGGCFCGVTVRPSDIAELSLLCGIYEGFTGMTCDLNQLLSDGACFCAVTKNPLEIVRLQLLCLIKTAASGGAGNNSVYYFGADPTSDGVFPPNRNAIGFAVSPTGGTLYNWNTFTQAWV